MLLAYIHRTGQEPSPDLCFLADKPDTYSVPVSVESLPITTNSIVRLGPNEAITVEEVDEGAKVVSPVAPSLLYLTPSQPDRPGIVVAKVRIQRDGEEKYLVQFQQEKDIQSGEWKEWNPNKSRR